MIRGRSAAISAAVLVAALWAVQAAETRHGFIGRSVGGAGGHGVVGGVAVGVVSVGGSFGGDCEFWCEARAGKYECCDSEKHGTCPPVRPQCPPVRSGYAPLRCSRDSNCHGYEKCCYDACLEHRTCKAPI